MIDFGLSQQFISGEHLVVEEFYPTDITVLGVSVTSWS